MTTGRLARHYDVLTPWERVALIVAAAARGDELEVKRLWGAAPVVRVEQADHAGHLAALERPAADYLTAQLELAVRHWRLSGPLGRDDPLGDDGEGDGADQLSGAVRAAAAYLLVTHAEAWRRLCAGLGVEPGDLLGGAPGHEALCRTLAAAGPESCGTDEAAGALGADPATVIKVERYVAGLRELLDWRVGRWE